LVDTLLSFILQANCPVGQFVAIILSVILSTKKSECKLKIEKKP